MQQSVRAIIFITLLLLPTSIHHDSGLCVGVSVQLSDN